jgi:hypothetical protein
MDKRTRRMLWPEQAAAWSAVRQAVVKGTLVKPDHCPVCGRKLPARMIQAHHKDYAKPLEVEWYCDSCHKDADRALGAL